MQWRTAQERVIPEAAGELAGVFGDALRTLVIYGRTVRHDRRVAGAAVDFAAVAEPLTFAHLRRVAQWWARWRSRNIANPLLFSASDLQRSRDVFPLEFLDIKTNHQTLSGDDLFKQLPIRLECLRTQCEREAKGKLLRLRALYLECCGSTRELRDLMLASHETFLLVARGLLYLRDQRWSGDARAALAAFERQYGRRMPIMTALAKESEIGPIEQRFGEYLAEIETLADVADRARVGEP